MDSDLGYVAARVANAPVHAKLSFLLLCSYSRIAVGGNSRGGYSGISLATRGTFATHAMCTHSNFLWQQASPSVNP